MYMENLEEQCYLIEKQLEAVKHGYPLIQKMCLRGFKICLFLSIILPLLSMSKIGILFLAISFYSLMNQLYYTYKVAKFRVNSRKFLKALLDDETISEITKQKINNILITYYN